MADPDVVWIPILPSFKDFSKNVESGTKGAGKSAGEQIARELETAVSKAESAVSRASGAAEKAQNRVADATGKVRIAQEQYNRALESGDTLKVATAEERLESARRRQTEATSDAERKSKNLEKAQGDLVTATERSSDALEALSDEAEGAGVALDDLGGKGAGLGGRLMESLRTMSVGALLGIGAKIGTSLMSGVQAAVKGGWDSALDIDTGTRVLEGMYETPEAAHDMLESLREVSRASSIDHSSYLEAAQALAYTGVQGESAVTIMENVGLAALASGKDGDQAFESMNGALARMVNEGKVGLESLQQLSGAGVPILSGLAEHFGVSMADVNKMATDGAIGFEDVLSVMENATGDYFQTALTAGQEAEGSLRNQMKRIKDNIFTTVGESLAPILASMDWQSIGEKVGSLADSVAKLVPYLMDMAMWAIENSDWLMPLAGVIGGITAAMWLLNAAMAVNPWMLLAGAVVALVAGLVIFFTQTETGKAIWEKFTAALATGWEAVKNAFSVAWAFIQPILSGLWDVLKIIGAVLLTAVVVPFQIGWQLISAAVMWAWNSIIKPAWDGMRLGLQLLGQFFTWVWTAIIQPVWNALGAGIAWVWNTVVRPVWDFMKAALGLVGAAFSFYWNNVIKPVWNALGAGIKWVWETVIRPAWDALKIALGAVGDFFTWVWNSVIKPAWDALGAGIRWVWDNVVSPVFEGIKTGLDLVKSAFRTAVDIIGSVWNEMREKTAAPIRFVIDTVYNKGIVGVWNKVAGWLGMDDKKLDEMKLSFASGGVMPGYTPGRDVHKFINPNTGQGLELSGGEAIMRPEWTRAVGGPAAVDRMNRDARYGRVRKHGRESAAFANGGVLSFAAGGIVEAMTRIVQAKYPMIQMTSGLRASNDLHGQGMAGDFSNGSGNTPAQLALANDIADTYPGSMELIYDSPGFDRTIKNGAFVGPFGQFYTWGQAGNHQHHVHWAMNTPPTMPFGGGVFEGGSDGSGGGGGSVIGSLVRSAMNKIMDPIMSAIPEGPGLIGGLGKGFGTKVWDEFKGWILSKVPSAGGSGAYGDWVGTPGVEQFRGLVEKLLKEKGQPLSLVGSVLRRMNQESGGDPNIVNNWDSNAAAGTPSKGLMQTIDPTFQAYKDPGFDNIWDPESNIRASMNYALARYGSLSAAYDRAGGYDNGGYLMPGTTLSINETDKPEPVFTNPQWTLIKSLVISTAELLDPIRVMAMHGRDAARHISKIADNTRRQLDHQIDMAGAAVWAALPGEVKDAVTIAGAVGAQWEKVSGYLNEKAIAWSKGEWPIGSARTPTVEPGPGWRPFLLDDSLGDVARANVDLAEQVIAGKVSAGNDPMANALFDIFGRDPILPDLARIAAMGPNAIEAATDAALHAFETGETARMEEWTASNSQLTEAVLRARDAAIVTGQMVQGAVNGYLNWAMASDSQGRMGSWQEYFQHYGGEYGTAQGDWLLSQVGLGGILGGKFKDSFANLLIATAESPLLSAPPILDDEGRVIGTQLQSTPEVAAAPQAAVLAEPPTVDLPDDTIDLDTAPLDTGTKVSVEIPEGKTALSIDEFKEILVRIDERLDNVEIAIDGEADPAPLGLGVGGIA